jgi:hypothetical protein
MSANGMGEFTSNRNARLCFLKHDIFLGARQNLREYFILEKTEVQLRRVPRFQSDLAAK